MIAGVFWPKKFVATNDINWARLVVWLIIGLVIYFTYSRYHSRVQRGEYSLEATSPKKPEPVVGD